MRYYTKRNRLKSSLAGHIYVDTYNNAQYEENEGKKSFDGIRSSTRMMFATDDSIVHEQETCVNIEDGRVRESCNFMVGCVLAFSVLTIIFLLLVDKKD